MEDQNRPIKTFKEERKIKEEEISKICQIFSELLEDSDLDPAEAYKKIMEIES